MISSLKGWFSWRVFLYSEGVIGVVREVVSLFGFHKLCRDACSFDLMFIFLVISLPTTVGVFFVEWFYTYCSLGNSKYAVCWFRLRVFVVIF